MTETLENLHNVFRWVVLLTGLGALVLGVLTATGRRPWDRVADRTSLAFTVSLDVQVLLGIALWVAGQRWERLDFIAVVHPLLALVAVGLAHVGRRRAEGSAGDRDRGRITFVFFVASLALLLLAIPFNAWPL